MMKYTLLLFMLLTSQLWSQQATRINNVEPRKDINGEIIDLHDGRIIKFGDRFYWYGTTYGKTTGFVRTNHYRVYSSPDMQTWRPEGKLLNNPPSGIYYRPHVVYNESTKKYVLWYNWYPKLWTGRFGVAVSDTPIGPFSIVNNDVQVAHSELGVGDFGLFVDDDGTAYISYNTIDGHRASVEKLSPDYLSSTKENGGFITEHCEAGSIFKRKGIYYLLTDYTCCFCKKGTGVRVYTSKYPTKGYQLKNNINRYPGTPAYGLVDGRIAPNQYEILRRNKEGELPSIELYFKRAELIDEVEIIQFTGNRGGICGDTMATAVHDPVVGSKFSIQIKEGEEWKTIPSLSSNHTHAIQHIQQLKFPP